MGPEQYRAAGLHRLSDSERAALGAWLVERGMMKPSAEPLIEERQAPEPAKVPAVAKAQSFGLEQLEKKKAAEPEVIEAQIAGSFRGWDGKTVFRLANGQIWQQRVGGRYRYRAEDPKVRIERARFGYYLEIQATGRKVGVKRIK